MFPHGRITSVAAVMAGGGGGGGGAGPRYWRLNITDNNSASHDIAALLEVQFHTGATGFGADSLEGGTASADSENMTIAQHFASGAADGELYDVNVPANLWASTNTSFPHWWKYDYGAGNGVEVVGVSIIARTDNVSNHEQTPRAFDVQWSNDDSSWTTKWSETGVTWSGFQFKKFLYSGASSYSGSPHGSHQHWRIKTVADNGGGLSSATEIEMRATPSGSDQCSGGAAISDGETAGLVDDNAFDNNNATFFASTSTSTGNSYIGYSFAAPVSVAEITWRCRQDSDANQSPVVLFFQYADSASGPWTTAWSATGQTGWSLGQTRTFTDPNYI